MLFAFGYCSLPTLYLPGEGEAGMTGPKGSKGAMVSTDSSTLVQDEEQVWASVLNGG